MSNLFRILGIVQELINFVGFIANSRDKYTAAKSTIKLENDK